MRPRTEPEEEDGDAGGGGGHRRSPLEIGEFPVNGARCPRLLLLRSPRDLSQAPLAPERQRVAPADLAEPADLVNVGRNYLLRRMLEPAELSQIGLRGAVRAEVEDEEAEEGEERDEVDELPRLTRRQSRRRRS